MKSRLALWGCGLVVVAIGPFSGLGRAALADESTTFTYQGRLLQAGAAVNDSCDIEIALWDAETMGIRVGFPQLFSAVGVVDGLFTVDLDYGASVFDGDPRWLEIAVSCPAGGALTVLAPRQPVLRAPYAIQTRGIYVNQNREVGIGTLAPNAPLHVVEGAINHPINTNSVLALERDGNAFLNISSPSTTERGVIFGDESTSGRGGILYNQGATPEGLQFRTNGLGPRVVIDKDGQMGVGALFPQARLDVDGADNDGTTAAVRIQSGTQAMLIDGNEIDSNSPTGLFLNNNVPNDVLLANGGGSVGIGTTSPEAALDINSAGVGLLLQRNSGTFANTKARMSISSNGGPPGVRMQMSANNGVAFTDTLFLGNTTDVGIGTVIPQAKLHVAGDQIIDTQLGVGTAPSGNNGLTIRETASSPGRGLRIVNAAGNKSVQTWVGSTGAVIDAEGTTNLHLRTGGSDRLIINNTTGNIGIGTASPQERLHIAGGTDVSGASGGFLFIGIPSSRNIGIDDNELQARFNGAPATMNINLEGGRIILGGVSGGNVGVRTTNPQADLHVAGTSRFDGAMTIATTTRHQSYPAFAFTPQRPETEIVFLGTRGRIVEKTSVLPSLIRATAAVHLPDGAVVTKLQARVFDVSTNAGVTVKLLRQRLADGTWSTMGEVTSTGSSGDKTISDTTISSSTINNASNGYWIAFGWLPRGTDLSAYSAVLTYQITSPLP